MTLSQLSRFFSRAGSLTRDARAVERSIQTGSPKPLVKRAIRKEAWKQFGKAMRKGRL